MTIPHLFDNWKSTVQSILTTTFAITGVLMVSSIIKPHTAGILVAVNSIAKILLGVFQTDGVQIPSGSTVTQTTTSKIETPAP